MGLWSAFAASLWQQNQEAAMADENPEITIRFSSKLVVTKQEKRPDPPAFCIYHFDEVVDLRPFAAEVIAAYPETLPIDAKILTLLCVKIRSGKYIRVAEYPPGVERNLIGELSRKMLSWMNWPRLEKGLLKTSPYFPDRKFRCGMTACDAAKRMNGNLVSTHGAVRTPLTNCWELNCDCTYLLVKKDGSTY
jgi:hypothetical protein